MFFRNRETKTKQQLARLRYLEREYPKLQKEIQGLREENAVLRATIEEQSSVIEQLKLRIEELEKMIFRSKRKPPDPPPLSDDERGSEQNKRDRTPRTAASYRRTVPTDDAVTDTIPHAITACPDCRTPLTRLRTVIRYVEDILPMEEWWKALKRVTKQEIVSGYCRRCKKQRSAIPIAKHTVILGEYIKQFTNFASTILRLSDRQIKDFLEGTIRFHVSDGELRNSTTEHARLLTPEYNALAQRIDQQKGSHWDETTWNVQAAGGGTQYAWVKTGTEMEETLFAFGKSRGKRVAETLYGKDPPKDRVGISDDYNVYENLFPDEKHQRCWAHPHRKLRDLKNSGVYSDTQRVHCRTVYEAFAALYADVRAVTKEPFRSRKRKRQHRHLLERFDAIVAAHPDDPHKLAQIKKRLRKQRNTYFVCLLHEGIPPDNNKAERKLRHVVLKRRMCHGSKTDHGADVSSILFSVLLSLWWTDKQSFFSEYNRLIQTSLVGVG